jgi:hypothetical protein
MPGGPHPVTPQPVNGGVIKSKGTKRKAPASEGLTFNLKKKKTTASSLTGPQNVATGDTTKARNPKQKVLQHEGAKVTPGFNPFRNDGSSFQRTLDQVIANHASKSGGDVTENTLVGILDKVFGCMDYLKGYRTSVDGEDSETEKTQLLLEASSVNFNLERMKSLAAELDAKLEDSLNGAQNLRRSWIG